MRLGVFGGSFDPIHYGHLLLAETCREQCELDEVWFIPAATPPHKQGRPISPAKSRIEMLQLGLGAADYFHLSTMEIDRGGVSYTVDTLLELRQTKPSADLFLLMGADSLNDFPTWRSPEQVCQLATPVVVRRAGAPEPDLHSISGLVTDDRLAEIRRYQVEMPIIDLSSSDIRRRVSEGRSIRFRTSRAVEKYIETAGLYRSAVV